MKAIIWGHKLHTHTHSYIHEGFYRAFEYLGHEVKWYSNEDDVSNIDFSNCVFLTEGQVDEKIPIRKDCKYILHYCNPDKYMDVIDNCIFLERSTQKEIKRLNAKEAEAIAPWTYIEKEYSGTDGWQILKTPIKRPAVYMLWATNLLPNEISFEENKHRGRTLYWVGSIGTGAYSNVKELGAYVLAATMDKVDFVQQTGLSTWENRNAIYNSYTAPALVGTWQLENGYVPCRVFKNISYGQLPCTNSKVVSGIFDDALTCNEDTYVLYEQAKEDFSRTNLLKELMQNVKENHTYVNRVKILLSLL